MPRFAKQRESLITMPRFAKQRESLITMPGSNLSQAIHMMSNLSYELIERRLKIKNRILSRDKRKSHHLLIK